MRSFHKFLLIHCLGGLWLPGIGKTDIAGQVAREQNMGFVSYSLAHHTRSSLLGLPVIITDEYGAKHTEYTMSELIASVEEKRKEGFEKLMMEK